MVEATKKKIPYLQWRRDSYRSASVITVLPLYLWVTSSLQHPTSKYVFGNLKYQSKSVCEWNLEEMPSINKWIDINEIYYQISEAKQRIGK